MRVLLETFELSSQSVVGTNKSVKQKEKKIEKHRQKPPKGKKA